LNHTKPNIRRLAEAGHRQKDIAQAVGLERSVVTKIINRNVQNSHESTINSTSAAEEIAAPQFEP